MPDRGNEKRALAALVLTGGFMAVEVAGGLLSGSLALLADAGHMLTDTAALALAYVAIRAARTPETARHTFGRHRLQVLAALVNGAALFGITIWIAVEAVGRLLAPVAVLGGAMLAVAVVGLLVNLASFLILRGGAGNINIRGAALHAMGDMLGSIGAIVAAGVILLTGWMPIDPILSVLVCGLILRSAWGLVQEAWHVLMEGVPDGVEVEAIRAALLADVPGVLDVHHIHLWSLTPEQPLATLHALVADNADRDEVLFAIKTLLRTRFRLGHADVQLEGRHFRDLLATAGIPPMRLTKEAVQP
ncbi:MAG: cation diffusion facilitator family transporter [Rhodopila sp.]